MIDLKRTALIVIDMQRDFSKKNGYADHMGLDVEILRQPIANIQKLLDWARQHQLLVVHTREGHRTDLTDLYSLKKKRTAGLKAEIGAEGPMGKLMLRDEYGHDLIDDLKPIAGEPVIDKPGYSAFAYTDLELILKNHDIKHLIISGVTTEVCVSSTFRQATDLGFYCITVEDACASANVDLHHSALQMITVENGIFGQVMCTEQVLKLVPEK